MANESIKVVATNRSARHDYFIDEVFEAGIVLMGTEVKSLRHGRVTIGEGYVSIDRGEAWLENAYIPEYTEGTWTNHAPRRKRKLLLHHTQIDQLAITTRERGVTIVPLKLYFLNGKAKLEIGVGRGKKLYDKRQSLKERQDSREAERAINTRR